MKTINDLLQHGEFRVRELGQRAVQYKVQLEHKEISPEEYANLRAQLVDLERLNDAADTADERQALAEAIEFIKTYLLPVVL